MEETLLSFVDTLPEAQGLRLVTVLREFFDSARKATTVEEINVAAGIAWQELEQLR